MKYNFILIILLVLSCKKDKEGKEIKNNTVDNYLTTSVYYRDIPQDTFHFQNRIINLSSIVNILSDNSLGKEFVFSDGKNVLQYPTKTKTSFLIHTYRGNDFYFELKKGDSISYYEQNGFPIYSGSDKVLNESNLYDYKKIKFLNNPPPYGFYYYYLLKKDVIKNSDTLRKSYIKQLNFIYKKETFLLDSLYQGSEITETKYQLEKEKLKFDLYNYLPPIELRDTIDEISSVNILNREDLIVFPFYRKFINNYTTYIYDIETLKQSNKTVLDFKSNFDSVLNSDLFSKKIKSILLYDNLVKIGTNFSQKDFSDYYSKFKTHVEDSPLISSIQNKFMTNFLESKEEFKEVYFITKQNKKRTLSEIVKENKGKIIYIDFWASWCAPCRIEMPASRRLQKTYKNKGVVFVYVSIDKDFEKWEKASLIEQISLDENNLLAVNYPKANLYKELKINTIPRYLVYNKKGKLINENAPNPSSVEIIDLIDELLRQ